MDPTALLHSLLTILLFYCLVSSSDATPTITTDQTALLALKQSVSYDPHNVVSTNWSGSSPVCSWIGITCSLRHHRVIALDVSNMSLEGKIPPALGSLSFLSSLKMRNNSFDGSLPMELAKLRRLRLIDLRRNNFSGPLPSFLTSLPNLRFLYLSRNGFSGSIPASIANLSKLEELALSRNFLEGEIPEGIGNLRHLTVLNLEGNDLVGSIPLPIFNLSALQVIAFTGNNLTGKLPESVCDNLPMLEEIYLSGNWLDGTIPSSLQKCKQLSVLALSVNEFIGSIPREIGNLTRLTKLYLAKNNLEGGIPEEIGNLGRLEKLRLNRNRLSGSLPMSIFNISALQEIAFTGNNMSICQVLRNLRHRNLTKVITSADFRALVLEYMPNGSLEKWLHSHNYFLDILQRLNIVIDVAIALEYLHDGYTTPVVHCDLKPSNVLLDEELVAHVSDFGISKIFSTGESMVQTKTLATIGYIAPEYGVEGLVSTRSDVYSFGILLMETFTRRRPNDDMFNGELMLKEWIKESIPYEITHVIDSNLLIQEEGDLDAKVQCSLSVLDVALQCTEESPNLRISMKDAVTTLNKIKLQFLASCGRS